ncbi:hypothetical protein DPMN_024805 [Dreissena polymorpha]|uniref:Uncharacterized protein n=1 Tax=Dreissena polymorpha TaxID=45954 RepID=A0A9D4RBY9_DREPO|nr:hypothetical protein DPMN_024805 [Dreissena polymorpha]
MFVLCLDKSIPIPFNHQRSVDETTSMDLLDDVSLSTQILHGQGSKINSCNRWFEETIQARMTALTGGSTKLCIMHQSFQGFA